MKHKKVRHFDLPGHAHELTFSCYEKLPLFKDDKACGYLADAISRARNKHSFDLWAYVFMPDHIHLLIYPREHLYSIASILQSIKQPVARKAILKWRRSNAAVLNRLASRSTDNRYHFWQNGPGFDRNVTDLSVVRSMAEYIHNNPVRKELASAPEEWYWSSAADWSGRREGPLLIDRESFPV